MTEELEDQGVPTTPRGSKIPEAVRGIQTTDLEAMAEPSPIASPIDQQPNSVHIAMSSKDATPSLSAKDCDSIPEDLELASGADGSSLGEMHPPTPKIAVSQADAPIDETVQL